MEENSFTETTTESWFSRIIGSIKNVILGILFFFGAFVLLWWNEGRAVKTATGLTEGLAKVISVDPSKHDNANDRQIVHLSGDAVTGDQLKDDDFGINVNAVRLERKVMMYQWVEDKEKVKTKNVGGSETTKTTYHYRKKWSSSVIRSSKFKRPIGHENPTSFPVSSYQSSANNVTIGTYQLSNAILSKMDGFEPYATGKINIDRYSNAQKVADNYIYMGKGTPNSPIVGDMKISFNIIPSGDIYSIVAQQVGNTFQAYKTKTGTTIEMVSRGTHSAESMFEAAQEENRILTWALRFGGWLLMLMGLHLVLKPLVVIADVLPFLGSILDFGLTLFSAIITFGLSLIVIAIAWIAYRPILAIVLLLIGGAGIGYVLFNKRAEKKSESYI